MSLLIREEEKSNGLMLRADDDGLVQLDEDNIAIAGAMIRDNPSYRKSFNSNIEGTTAYCIHRLIDDIRSSGSMLTESIVYNAVVAVDKDNSTHLNADGCGRAQLTNRIVSYGKEQLIIDITNPKGTDYKLIKHLSTDTEPTGHASSGKQYKPRSNRSFASKFCHFLCYYYFDDERKDNFPIYDNIMLNALPLYLDKYSINYGNKERLKTYKNYVEAIEALTKKMQFDVSKNALERLIWYYHNGR